MDPDTLLTNWGFFRNPFRIFVAEKERDTPNIFIEPPFFSDILGSANDPISAIVFGQRGDGKSTLCEMINHYLTEQTPAPLVINYVHFPHWREEDIRQLTLEQHLERIIALGIDQLIKRMEREIDILQRLSNDEKAILQWYVLVFFPAGEYRQAEKRLMKLIDKLPRVHRVKKIGGWGFRRLANYLRRRRIEIERVSDDSSPVVQIIKSALILIAPSMPESQSLKGQTDMELLKRFRQLVASAGIHSIVVLIDKIDEHELCAEKPELAAQLVRPIVTSVAYLEIDGIATKLFLPKETKEILGNRIRTDRIVTREISWANEGMRLLLKKRLLAFSRGQINSMEPFVEEAAWQDFERKLYFYAAHSPRNMIRILDNMVSMLCELETEPSKITSAAIDLGLRSFLDIRLVEQDGQEYQRRLDSLMNQVEPSEGSKTDEDL